MVYQGATGLYHFLINVIPFISNSVVVYRVCSDLSTFKYIAIVEVIININI